MHPGARRCSSVEDSRSSPSSRLDRRAPRPSRCDAALSPRAARRSRLRAMSAIRSPSLSRPVPAVLAAVRPVCRVWRPPQAPALSAVAPAAQARTFDVVIANGRVVDGTGAPWFRADVGITGDRITAIGNLSSARAVTRIDAAGQVVAPGFIDLLGQSEFNVLVDSRAASKITQGITTEITGEGVSIAPVNDVDDGRPQGHLRLLQDRAGLAHARRVLRPADDVHDGGERGHLRRLGRAPRLRGRQGRPRRHAPPRWRR